VQVLWTNDFDTFTAPTIARIDFAEYCSVEPSARVRSLWTLRAEGDPGDDELKNFLYLYS
jgi:hypothetical protein